MSRDRSLLAGLLLAAACMEPLDGPFASLLVIGTVRVADTLAVDIILAERP